MSSAAGIEGCANRVGVGPHIFLTGVRADPHPRVIQPLDVFNEQPALRDDRAYPFVSSLQPPTLSKAGVKGPDWQGTIVSAIEPHTGHGLSQQEVRLRAAAPVEELRREFAITPIR